LQAGIDHYADSFQQGWRKTLGLKLGIADATVFTTHKTICGPRAAVILTTDEERAAKIDSAVFPAKVEAARKFFTFREDATLHAYVDDGRRFIENCREPYDVIFLDAFGSDSIPYHLATREFLQAVRAAVSPKGVVLANVWSSNSNPLYESMVHTYQDVFEGLYIIDVFGAGNRILVALPRKEEIKPEEFVEKARAVSRQRNFPFDMGESVGQGFRKPERDDVGGEVLRDKRQAKKAG